MAAYPRFARPAVDPASLNVSERVDEQIRLPLRIESLTNPLCSPSFRVREQTAPIELVKNCPGPRMSIAGCEEGDAGSIAQGLAGAFGSSRKDRCSQLQRLQREKTERLIPRGAKSHPRMSERPDQIASLQPTAALNTARKIGGECGDCGLAILVSPLSREERGERLFYLHRKPQGCHRQIRTFISAQPSSDDDEGCPLPRAEFGSCHLHAMMPHRTSPPQ